MRDLALPRDPAGSPGTEFRLARPDDAEPLLKLISDHARYEKSEAIITGCGLLSILERSHPPIVLFVADKDEELLGYGALTFDFSLWRAQKWGHLDCLFVAEKHRGKKVGEQLFSLAREHARSVNADRLEWQTPAWNTRARKFYTLLGADHQTKIRFNLSI